MENGIGEACSEALASGERQDPCVRRLTDAALKETENTFAALGIPSCSLRLDRQAERALGRVRDAMALAVKAGSLKSAF
jgi:hypothetical protein